MTSIKRFCAIAAAVFGIGFASHANLLTNGSFESGNFIPDANDTMSLLPGATDITGWTVENAALAWIGPSNPFSLSASDGSYFLDLTGYHDNAPFAGVQQTIATTIGAQYQLTFDIGSDINYDSDEGSVSLIPVSILATAGSSSQLFTTTTPTGINQWESFSYDFTATSASTLISLQGEATENVQYIGLDNASVQLIPEPGTLALFAGSGLIVLVGWRRSRKA